MSTDRVRQVILLPRDLKRQLAVEAAQREMTVSDLVIEAIHNRMMLIRKRSHGTDPQD